MTAMTTTIMITTMTMIKEQLLPILSQYPWLPLAAGALLGLAVSAVVRIRRRRKKREQPFVILADPSPSAGKAKRSIQERPARRRVERQDGGLKSYQLTLVDLDAPDRVYRVFVTDRITIGRRTDCMVSIPNQTLSGIHCEIVLKNGAMYIHDLDSKNGTYVNGSKIRGTEAVLASGDVIELGSARLRVQISVIR